MSRSADSWPTMPSRRRCTVSSSARAAALLRSKSAWAWAVIWRAWVRAALTICSASRRARATTRSASAVDSSRCLAAWLAAAAARASAAAARSSASVTRRWVSSSGQVVRLGGLLGEPLALDGQDPARLRDLAVGTGAQTARTRAGQWCAGWSSPARRPAGAGRPPAWRWQPGRRPRRPPRRARRRPRRATGSAGPRGRAAARTGRPRPQWPRRRAWRRRRARAWLSSASACSRDRDSTSSAWSSAIESRAAARPPSPA